MPPAAPAKKKKGQSKEELERIAREQEEQLRLQELLQREREAEERQKRENERRDADEEEERKRAKKEEQMRLMAEKDHRILMLTTELDSQKTTFSSERFELESELERMLQLKDWLLNEISVLRSESDDVQRKLIDDRSQVTSALEALRDSSSKASREQSTLLQNSKDECAQLAQQLNSVKKDHDELLTNHKRLDWESSSRTKNLERELEKTKGLANTLQETLKERNEEDRRNITLLQMLNHQLDENKRRSQELIEEERQRTSQVNLNLVLSETMLKQTQEENDVLKREREGLKQQAESDLHDYKSKLEQMKFDMKYLHSELHSYKSLCSKYQQDSTQLKAATTTETNNARIEVESFQKKVDELESLLRRKDRENFDKVTFLNAQISNNRTIIAQLQQKLSREREDYSTGATAIQAEVQAKDMTIQTMKADIEKRKSSSQDAESKMAADISILKSTVFQLQAALVEREKQLEVIRASKDEEIHRLRAKLDEHFIPHRADGDQATGPSVEFVLSERVGQLTQELEVRNKVAIDNEARLKAQITNQNQIIDTLQAELYKAKSEWQADVKLKDDECSRLRKTLDVHFIPYQK